MQRATPSDTGRTAPARGAYLPRIGVLKALNRHRVREFNPDRNETP